MPYTVIDPGTAAAAPAVVFGAPRSNFGKTLATLRAELVLDLGNRAEATVDRLDRWINDAYTDLCGSLDLPQLFASYSFNTVVGQPLYTIPDGVEYTKGVAVVDPATYTFYEGRPLKKIDLETYRALRAATDEPKSYFRFGNLLVLYPTPVATRVLAVEVRISPQSLTADTDSPFLPKSWHEVVLKGARMKAFSSFQEWPAHAEAENEYVAMVRRKQDPGAGEDNNRLVGSSVPRTKADLYRLQSTRTVTEL